MHLQPVFAIVIARIPDDAVGMIGCPLVFTDAPLADVFYQDRWAVNAVVIALRDVVGRADPGEIKLVQNNFVCASVKSPPAIPCTASEYIPKSF